jgi:hypothetical protein
MPAGTFVNSKVAAMAKRFPLGHLGDMILNDGRVNYNGISSENENAKHLTRVDHRKYSSD